MAKQTHEEKLAKKREWYHKNIEKVRAGAKKSREKHKERRRLENKLWNEKNKEHLKSYQKEYGKKWYQLHKVERDKQNIEWAKNNPDKVKKIKESFKRRNPEVTKKYLKDYQVTLKGKYRVLKGSATKRNYEVQITFEEFSQLVSNPCSYCGESEKRIGIDRIDNSKGYILENSTPCCTTCNMMKKALNVDEFLKHITKIHNHSLLT